MEVVGIEDEAVVMVVVVVVVVIIVVVVVVETEAEVEKAVVVVETATIPIPILAVRKQPQRPKKFAITAGKPPTLPAEGERLTDPTADSPKKPDVDPVPEHAGK